MLTNEVGGVYVEGKAGYEIAKKYAKSLIPQKLRNIKLYKDKTKLYLMRIILNIKSMICSVLKLI